MEEIENDEALEATLMELAITREAIEQVRANTIQSWLKSAPLIDELEKQQSMLSRTKKQVAMATSVIASLGSLLETTTRSAESKEDDDCKNMIVIEETTLAKERHQQEMEKLVAETELDKGLGRKLKEELRIRRQSLRTLQLKMRAVSMEIEAFNSSLELSHDLLNHLNVEDETIILSHDELCSLQREVDNERHAAEVSKENALKRLEELYNEKKMKESTIASVTNEMENNETMEHQNQVIIRSQICKRRAKGRRNNKIYKYKPNILQKILKLLCSGLR